jgi:hypothetical protein
VSNSELVKDWTEKAFKTIQIELGAEWDNVTGAQKASLKRALKRSVQLKIKESKGEDVSDQLAFIDTTINGFKLAGQVKLYSVTKSVLGEVLEGLGKFLAGVAKGLIPGF